MEVVTLLCRRRAVEPARTDGLCARLGATADDELAVVEHVWSVFSGCSRAGEALFSMVRRDRGWELEEGAKEAAW